MSQLLLAPRSVPGRPRDRQFGPDNEPKTEPRKDAGPKLYANTARPEDAARRRFAGSGSSLGERIGAVWDGLLRTGAAECPVCRGTMERSGDAGRCRACGSVLS